MARALVVLMTVALGMVGLSVGTASAAPATHYRANQLTWHAGSGTNEAEFHLNGSWRCTFFFDPCTASVGDTFQVIDVAMGDGTFENPVMTVTSVDVANDVVTAEAHFTHTYPGTGPYTASVSDCCRLSGPQHINNPDGSIRYETVVNFAATTASPQALVAPIVDCPINALCTFTVPAVDPDGQGLNWRMSTFAEGLLSQPSGATIGAATGLYSWDTTGATLNTSGNGETFYSTQVMVENVVGGNVVSQTAVDFFIRLSNNTTNQPPVFVTPTPADGAVITGTVGVPLTIDLAATDPDAGDTVTIGLLGSVPGLTFSGTPGNPATGTYTGAPTTPGDYPLTATAADQLGLGATPRGYTVRIAAAPTNPPPVVDAGVPLSGQTGTPFAIDASATDTEPITTAWTATPGAGITGTDTCTFADPTAIDTTVTCTGVGTWTLTLTATDSANPPVSDSTTLVLKAPPATTISVKGQGYVRPPCTTYTVNVTKSGSKVSGMVRVRNRTGIYFRSTKIVSVTITGNTAKIVARGKWNNQVGYTATVTLVDGTPDKFGVKVKKGATTVLNAPLGSLIRGNNTITS